MERRVRNPAVLARAVALVATGALIVQLLGMSTPEPQSVTVWRFYRALPGFEQEFTSLFRKNTYRVLQAQLAGGEILDLQLYTPAAAAGTGVNWTLLLSIRYTPRNGAPPTPSDSLVQALFRDRAAYELEKIAEVRLLDAQWEVSPRPLP
ncbi:MAG: hypothetical protein HYU37_06755 [Acidobacteria bacterium]|nr:hypothetical protein [Acidobacteriota bacterium]